jgi:hypothetical protein
MKIKAQMISLLSFEIQKQKELKEQIALVEILDISNTHHVMENNKSNN